jgi:fibronectin type 3 domain-containing protein
MKFKRAFVLAGALLLFALLSLWLGVGKGSLAARLTFHKKHSVTLRWNASVTAGVDGYNIYRSTSPTGPYVKINHVKKLSYVDHDVKNGDHYYYVVRGTVGDRESSDSNRAEATIPQH